MLDIGFDEHIYYFSTKHTIFCKGLPLSILRGLDHNVFTIQCEINLSPIILDWALFFGSKMIKFIYEYAKSKIYRHSIIQRG